MPLPKRIAETQKKAAELLKKGEGAWIGCRRQHRLGSRRTEKLAKAALHGGPFLNIDPGAPTGSGAN
jgi:hypothetical protein